MKRFAAMALAATLILCIFVSCEKKATVDGAEVITNDAGQQYAVATKEDGGVIRDNNGDVVILATDEDGQAVTNDKGENETENAELKNALVIGNLIEFDRYYIELPEGWSNNGSFSDMIFRNDSTGDQIWVIERAETSVATAMDQYDMLRAGVLTNFPDAVTEDFPVEINGETCAYSSVYVPVDSEGTPSYLGETHIANGGYCYTFRVTSKRDVTADIDDIINIISTIKFK